MADNNYLALQSFFAKFPNFTQNEFYIFGESYGGIYAPTLSLRVATGGQLKVNFKVIFRFNAFLFFIFLHSFSHCLVTIIVVIYFCILIMLVCLSLM